MHLHHAFMNYIVQGMAEVRTLPSILIIAHIHPWTITSHPT